MKIINLQTRETRGLTGTSPAAGPLAVALGCFDGVHIGHADILRHLVDAAAVRGMKSAVWTFDDPLVGTLSRAKSAPNITTLHEKLDRIAALGVDYAVLADFAEVKSLPPDVFVRDVLVGQLGCAFAVCGFNFRFGAGAAGDSDTLLNLMRDCGGEGIVIPPVMLGTHIVSSTLVRRCLQDGDMEMAARLLGRPFSIDFPVVRGHQLGRKIGIPTINQDFPEHHVIPHTGIYACLCDVDGSAYLGVANVGCRPTVSGGDLKINCETHIIQYSGFLYDRSIRVSFYQKLRDEKKFSSVEQLRLAIGEDIRRAQEYFSRK